MNACQFCFPEFSSTSVSLTCCGLTCYTCNWSEKRWSYTFIINPIFIVGLWTEWAVLKESKSFEMRNIQFNFFLVNNSPNCCSLFSFSISIICSHSCVALEIKSHYSFIPYKKICRNSNLHLPILWGSLCNIAYRHTNVLTWASCFLASVLETDFCNDGIMVICIKLNDKFWTSIFTGHIQNLGST